MAVGHGIECCLSQTPYPNSRGKNEGLEERLNAHLCRNAQTEYAG